MEREIKCGRCGNQVLVSDEIHVNDFVTPRNYVEKAYFDLWHFPIQRCSHCNYAGVDISSDIGTELNLLEILENPIIAKLKDARPNDIEDYLLAAATYESVGEQLLQAKCLLQAGDLCYDEAMYWRTYILDEDEDEEDYDDIIAMAQDLYERGTSLLKDYVLNHPEDIDNRLLLIGVIQESGRTGRFESQILIENLRKQALTETQRVILEFLSKN